MDAYLFGCAARRRAASGLLAAVLLAVATANAGPGIWLAGDGSIQNPPKIEAIWGLFDLSVGLEYMGVSVEAVIGYLMCTANFEPDHPSADDEGRTFYSWKNSGNWDSIGLTVAHVKKVYNYLQNPLGILMSEIHGERNDEKGLDELTTAGPNRQTVTISFDDLPIVPDGVSVGVGTELRFDVNIQGPHRVRLDQNAEVEKLTVGAGSTLLCDQQKTFRINNGLDSAGTVSGGISWIGGGIRNSGSFYAGTGGSSGGIENSGLFCGQGSYGGPIRNDGQIRIVGSGAFFDTPRVHGSGSFLNETYAILRNSADAAPISLEQDLVTNGHLMFWHPFTTAPGVAVRARGYLYGEGMDGHIVAQPGQQLRLRGWTGTGSRVDAEGAGTVLEYEVTNAGFVRVANGAGLVTLDGDCHNFGTLEVDNAEVVFGFSWPPVPGLYRAGVANTGVMRFSNSTLTFPIGIHAGNFVAKHICGDGTGINTGTVRIENGSQVFNPAIVDNRVTIDATSRVEAGENLHSRLGNYIENWGEISTIGTIYGVGVLEMDGTLINRNRIINNSRLIFSGNLTNDGEILSSGTLTLNVVALAGTGRVVSTGSTSLRNPFNAAAPVRIEQEFHPENYLSATPGLAIEPGRTIRTRGEWYVDRLSGEVEVRPGQSLAMYYGAILPDGRVRVAGNGTTLLLGMQNEGEIHATSGGEVVTWDNLCGNSGTIRAEDATLRFHVAQPWNQHQAEFPNTGAIQLTRSTMSFPWGSFSRKYISGNGTIAAEDQSIIENPMIDGPQVFVDSTSRVVVTDPSFSVTLRGSVLNEGEVSLAGGFNVGGQWLNRRLLRSAGYGTFRGELINDGLVHVTGGEMTLDIPLLTGAGEIRSEGGLWLRQTAVPDAPMQIAQQVTSAGYLRSDTFFTTAPDTSVHAGGRFLGKSGGAVNVLPGTTLRVELGDLATGARIEAAGAGTSLEFYGGINRGVIEVRDSAQLVASPFWGEDFINEGVVRLRGSAEARFRGWPFYLASGIENRGQIQVEQAALTCEGKGIFGNGLVSARNGSTLTNLETGGQPLIYADPTSRLRFTSGFNGAIWGVLLSEGDVELDNATLTIQGDWTLGTPTSGSLSIASPSTIRLAGDLSVRLRNPDDFDGQRATIRALDRGTLGLYWNRLVGDPSQIIPEPTATAVWAVGAIFLRGCWRRRRMRQRPR